MTKGDAHRKKITQTSEIWRQREVGVNKKKKKERKKKYFEHENTHCLEEIDPKIPHSSPNILEEWVEEIWSKIRKIKSLKLSCVITCDWLMFTEFKHCCDSWGHKESDKTEQLN